MTAARDPAAALGRNIRLLREARGLTQRELAALASLQSVPW